MRTKVRLKLQRLCQGKSCPQLEVLPVWAFYLQQPYPGREIGDLEPVTGTIDPVREGFVISSLERNKLHLSQIFHSREILAHA